MRDARRIIDANANRAREALRVMEDVARFALDHQPLCAELKSIRHALRDALGAAGLDALELASSRDTPGDVGTVVATPSEGDRDGLRGVALAAGKRLSEALRCVEETAKTLPDGGALAHAIERLRYRAYDAEGALVRAMGTGRARQWRVCVILTSALCPGGDWERVVRAAVEGGADCLQLREKDLPDRELLERARRLVGLAREHAPTPDQRASVIVNDRPDIALLAGADGVHLGQSDLTVRDVRALAGSRLLVGVSASNIGEAERALRDGADSCGVGAMFPTSTKRKDAIVGPGLLRDYLAHEPALPPHLAIGGVTPGNIGALAALGARGVAVCGCVCASPEPAQVVRALRDALERAPANV
ncbi:MAG: thiamine phosphate synthase [Phycisphaerales bacterium]|nr:MAG: thiamine phosphate synthase [Phycisphaerales bacterium]